jgi:hypothetical protein
MKNSWESGSRIRNILEKTLETGIWSGIILSRMFSNLIPAPIKKMEMLPHYYDDRRRDRRLHVDRTVTCACNGKDMEKAHLINISRSGMYVEIDNPPDVGQEMNFNLSGKNLGSIMRVRGQVIRRAERGMAIQFT